MHANSKVYTDESEDINYALKFIIIFLINPTLTFPKNIFTAHRWNAPIAYISGVYFLKLMVIFPMSPLLYAAIVAALSAM